jgi:hypothetical protein
VYGFGVEFTGRQLYSTVQTTVSTVSARLQSVQSVLDRPSCADLELVCLTLTFAIAMRRSPCGVRNKMEAK